MYEQRLRKRGSESDANIARRLETAQAELARISEYQHVVINDEIESAARAFFEVIRPHFPQ
jgi:guanylate kinase